MKKLIFIVIILKCFDVQANDWNVVSGTLHKTINGKYPFYFADDGQEPWTDALQKDYDEKMSATLKELCSDQVQLGDLEKQYQNADQNKAQLEIGNKMQSLKTDIARLSGIVVKGTGQEAQTWGCP